MTTTTDLRPLISLARLVRVAAVLDPALSRTAGVVLDRALGLPVTPSPSLLSDLLSSLPAELRAEVAPAPVPQATPAPVVVTPEQAAAEPSRNGPGDVAVYSPRRPVDELIDALDEEGISPAQWDIWAAVKEKPSLFAISDEAATKATAWVRAGGAARIRADLAGVVPAPGGAR